MRAGRGSKKTIFALSGCRTQDNHPRSGHFIDSKHNPYSKNGVSLVRTHVSEELSASFIRAHGVTSQKTQFFIITAVKTSNLTQSILVRKTIYRKVLAYMIEVV
jgi:hypothetical protein